MSVETRIMCLKQRGNPIYMFPGNKTSWLSRYCRLPKALNLRLAQDLSLKRRLSSVKDVLKLSPPLNQDGNNRKGKHFLAIRVPFSDVPTPFILISYSTTLGHRILRDGSETLKAVSSFPAQGNAFTFVFHRKASPGEKTLWLPSVTISRTGRLGVTVGSFLWPRSVLLVSNCWLDSAVSSHLQASPSSSVCICTVARTLITSLLDYYFFFFKILLIYLFGSGWYSSVD